MGEKEAGAEETEKVVLMELMDEVEENRLETERAGAT